MTSHAIASPRSLLRRYLVAGYAAFIVYASLLPFFGWQEQGFTFGEVLSAPFAQTYTAFDTALNVLAYLPFGMLLALTLRVRFGPRSSMLLATLGAVLLSAAMEYLQMYLPSRTSSNVDILANGIGGCCGALLAAAIERRDWFRRLTAWRIGLFSGSASTDFGLALLMLWLFAQINPSLPLLGSVFIPEPAAHMYLPEPPPPFSGWESAAVTLNLLMGGLLLLLLLRERRHLMQGMMLLLGTAALSKFVAAALLLKSWALLLWLNGEAMLGIVAGLLLLEAVRRLPPVWLVRGALLAALSYLVLVHGVLDSGTPSAAMRLYHWQYGHLRNYNRLSQTVSSLFPLLLVTFLWWSRGARQRQEGKR